MEYREKIKKIISHGIFSGGFLDEVSARIFTQREMSMRESAEMAIDWLLLAGTVSRGKGIAGLYSPRYGWSEAYPETTGYIIPTLLNSIAAYDYRAEEIRKLCMECGEWLLGIQRPDGSFGSFGSELPGSEPFVFDTGQILFGFAALFQETGDTRYLDALSRAANWLVSVQGKDGSWSAHTFDGVAHTFDTRVSWALLVAAEISGIPAHASAARKNLE